MALSLPTNSRFLILIILTSDQLAHRLIHYIIYVFDSRHILDNTSIVVQKRPIIRSIHREKSRGDLSKKSVGTEKENRKKRDRRKIATLHLADHLGHPRGSHRIFGAHATCSRPCAPLPSFRAFSMPPLSSRRRSRRRAHRNPSSKVGGKNSFLVIARGIPRVDHARRSV